MPILLGIIAGGVAGILVAYFMRLQVHIFVAVAIGILGAVFAAIALRGLIILMSGLSSVATIFISGIIGAIILILLFRFFYGGNHK